MKTKDGLFLVCIASMLCAVSPVMADDLKDELVAIEKAQWQAWKDRNGEAYRDVITDDAVFVSADASIEQGKEAVVADISGHECQVNSLNFADFNVRQYSSDTAILIYTFTQDVSCGGQKLPNRIFAESVYVRQEGKWRTASYQETAIE